MEKGDFIFIFLVSVFAYDPSPLYCSVAEYTNYLYCVVQSGKMDLRGGRSLNRWRHTSCFCSPHFIDGLYVSAVNVL